MLSHQENFTVYLQILRQIWRYDICDIRRNEEMHRAPRDTHRNQYITHSTVHLVQLMDLCACIGIFELRPNSFSWIKLITTTIKSSTEVWASVCCVHSVFGCVKFVWPVIRGIVNKDVQCSFLSSISLFNAYQCDKYKWKAVSSPCWSGQVKSTVTVLILSRSPVSSTHTQEQYSFASLLWPQTNMLTTYAPHCIQSRHPKHFILLMTPETETSQSSARGGWKHSLIISNLIK